MKANKTQIVLAYIMGQETRNIGDEASNDWDFTYMCRKFYLSATELKTAYTLGFNGLDLSI